MNPEVLKQIIALVEKALEEAIPKAAYDMEAYAVRIAPVDTGRLRSSIHVTVEDNKITLSAGVDYAPFVEYGTSKMKAQPFLRPAVYLTIQKFLPDRLIKEISRLAVEG